MLKIAFLLLFCPTLYAQQPVSELDLTQTIAFYKSTPDFRKRMPPPVTDNDFRKAIHRRLPSYRRVTDPEIHERMMRVLDPVFFYYQRANAYDLIVIDSPTPIITSVSGVVLVISTSVIRRAESDDELLGYAAHEIAHEYFTEYSLSFKYVRRLLIKHDNEPVLNRRISELLAIIELQCDAFAAVTLSSLGYDSFEFIRGMERTLRDFHKDVGNYPPGTQRRYLVEQLSLPKTKPRQSDAFKELKRLVEKSKPPT